MQGYLLFQLPVVSFVLLPALYDCYIAVLVLCPYVVSDRAYPHRKNPRPVGFNIKKLPSLFFMYLVDILFSFYFHFFNFIKVCINLRIHKRMIFLRGIENKTVFIIFERRCIYKAQ